MKFWNLIYNLYLRFELVFFSQKSKVELKTLDSTLTRQLANGEKRSVSSKCAEMDREVGRGRASL
jgi:hypothetical protein